MAETTLQDLIERALRQVAESPAFLELARVCPYSEMYFQVQDGRYVSGQLRVKGRDKAKEGSRPRR